MWSVVDGRCGQWLMVDVVREMWSVVEVVDGRCGQWWMVDGVSGGW